jgi:hypothetical protein
VSNNATNSVQLPAMLSVPGSQTQPQSGRSPLIGGTSSARLSVTFSTSDERSKPGRNALQQPPFPPPNRSTSSQS